MAITAAEIEANGWVLALTFAGSLTSPATNFGAYALTPDATPKVVLPVASAGFVKSAGTAVSGTMTRALVGMVPLRKVVDPTAATTKLLDETDLGGGSIKVRIALSEEVHSSATDTVGTLAVLAGWRTGESAQSGITVTNNSTLTPPLPVMRWVLPPYEVATGVFRMSLLVGSVYPLGFEPVAGVKFTATDGTTVKTVWATALGTDNTYGDNLRCYTVTLDPTTGTALTAGLLRCDAEVYPWLGAMRSTDPAGTLDMTTLRTDGFKTAAASPFVIGYDPAGTRYSAQHVYVDQVNGTTTASAAMVATTLAGAKAVTAASRAKDVSTAIQALGLQNRTLAAANGQASATKSVDGAKITLAPGTHAGIGATAVGVGLNAVEIPMEIVGDPADSNPRANCIIDTTSGLNTRCARIRWRNLTVLTGGSALNTSTTIYNIFDNVEKRGRSGSESVSTAPVTSGAAAAGLVNSHYTNSRVWRTGFSLGGANRQIGLLRKCEFSRRATGHTFIKNRWISKTEDTFNGSNTTEGIGTIVQTADIGSFEDVVVAYNDFRSIILSVHAFAAAPAALTGTSRLRYLRHLILNNVYERISGTATAGTVTSNTMIGYGEASLCDMDTLITEGNTVAGGAANMYYNDPVPVTLSDISTQNNTTKRIRHANNAVDRNASKHDDFSDPSTATIRAANGISGQAGYRPALIGCWSVHFGVGVEGHVDCSRRGTIPNFFREFSGLRGVQFGTPTAPGWKIDKTEAGDDLGGGDYTPVAGSPFLNRARRGNSDVDWLGAARRTDGTGAAGAIERADVEYAATLAISPITVSGAFSGTVASNFSATYAMPATTIGGAFDVLPLGIEAGFEIPPITIAAGIQSSLDTQIWTIIRPRPASTFTVTFSGEPA